MEHARPPTELHLEGGPAARADAWRKWHRQFVIFLKASGVHKESADVQASLLINLIGSEGYDIYSTFKFTKQDDSDDINKIIAKFDEHFATKPNITMARFKFFTRNQEKGESVTEYVTALKILSQYCEFQDLEDGIIRDRLVCGVLDSAVRDRLLRTDDLTLAKAVKICEVNEISNEENRHIEIVKAGTSGESRQPSAGVDALFGAGALRGRGSGRRGRGAFSSASMSRAAQREYSGVSKSCGNCGDSRCNGVYCAAKYVKCFMCNARGHYKKMCPVKYKDSKKIYELCDGCEDLEIDEDDRLFHMSSVEDGSRKDMHIHNINNDCKWYESLILVSNGCKVNFKLDTGADFNVLSIKTFLNLGYSFNDIKQHEIRAQSYCGNYLPITGTCTMTWRCKNKMYSIEFVMADMECKNVLGKHTCEKLELVKRILSLSMSDYDDLFRGVGKLPGEHKIVLERDASPSVCPVRKIPIGVRGKLQECLSHMVDMGIIRKVTHPTPWVNAIVLAAKKNGDLRICLDPRPLNRVIRRAHFPLPTLTEIATKLQGARYFSKLDARSGFWMVQIDNESADLCTFGTPFGRYQFLRLPYGISSASEIFHSKVRQLLEDLEGVDSFIDDIIIWASSKEEHDMRLKRLLDRAREVGIRFNREKCQFGVQEVTYLGHTFNVKGMQIEENKLKAIKEMPVPSNRATLERFLGMVNYLSKFISHYSEMVGPLRNLLKKNVEWTWDATHDVVVSQLKDALCNAPVLALYSGEKPVLISVDASANALGAVLLQEGRPVEFASLTLTDTQRRYAQIEKEMLAIVFALERFRQYVYGKHDVVIETDHKPLEALFKKTLDAVPARLQRMMLRVQAYSFQAVYKPGKYMYVADTLSRAALPELMSDKISTEVEEQSCFLIENVNFSNERLRIVKEAVQNDDECQILIEYIKEGWPKNKCDTDTRVRHHWAHRETLEYVEGVIFKDNLVFIPKPLRDEMVNRVHEGHLGIERCKRRARDVMFWCGMSRDVERTVRRCRACAEHAAAPPREPMISHNIPELPWTKIGSDICEHGNKYYLILVDYFSNFIEVNILNNISSRSVINVMREQFARHGIPEELITDNGPAYASKEFHDFSKEWGFKHITSSPNYAQSNGLSERAVRTIKNLVKKSIFSGTDFYLGLLNLRSSPREGISSPSQLLMGRRLRTRLPIHSHKLCPERNNTQDYDNIIRNRLRSKRYYDTHSRPMSELQQGDKVLVSQGHAKRTMHVQSKTQQPRSYMVCDKHGRVYRRNRRHLVKLEPPDASLSQEGNRVSDKSELGRSHNEQGDDTVKQGMLERVQREAARRARDLIGNMNK